MKPLLPRLVRIARDPVAAWERVFDRRDQQREYAGEAPVGMRFGLESFYGSNDADPELSRALWCLVRHLRPTKTVETGVAHGISSRVILEALERSGHGRLWSIDPPPEARLAGEVGVAVDGIVRQR